MTQPRISFLFPGQASQYVGMGQDLYSEYSEVRMLYQQAQQISSYDIAKISFEGPAEILKETQYTQLAILVHSVASALILSDSGIKPEYVAGHSIGEYSALVACGSLKFLDAVELVCLRSKLMQEAADKNPGTMAAVIGLSPTQVDELCHESTREGETVQSANFNSPNQTVIAGAVPAVERAMEIAQKIGARRTVRLNVSGAFHSELMAEAKDGLRAAIENAKISRPNVPLIANVTAQAIKNPDDIRKLLIKQLTSPVRWAESIQTLFETGVDIMIEVGPGNVLGGLLKRFNRDIKVFKGDSLEDISKIRTELS
tara:strand:- start:102338 stop:103279 length:942 start_codon:yes stop_codon:yes gene_type:complete